MSVIPGEIRQRYEENRQAAQSGQKNTGFNAPGGDIPRQDYWYQPGTSKAARGSEEINLNYEGLSIDNQSLDLTHKTATKYPQGYIRVSGTGDPNTSHAVVYDDTSGGERICYRHACGSGIDMKPDGSIVIVSRNNKVDLTTGNHHVIVEANGTMIYRGDVNMKVEGDYNLEVGGNYNIKVGGNWNLNVVGSYSKRIIGSFIESVGKNKFVTVLGDLTQTLLGKVSESIKGNHSLIVKGEGDYNYGQDVVVTSEVEVSMSAPSINAVAQDMTLTGNTGTIGGENIVMYNYNMFTGHSINAIDTVTTKSVYATDTLNSQTITGTRINSTSMHASTFHGDLNGTAQNAVVGGTDTHPGSSHGFSVSSIIQAAIDVTAANTTKGPKKWPTDAASDYGPTGRDDQKPVPTEVTTKLWLENGVAMVQSVFVDEDDGIRNDQDLTNATGGVTHRPLKPNEVIAKLRTKSNRDNTAFTQKMIEQKCLDPSYTEKVPKHVGRIIGNVSQARLGQTIIGQRDLALTNTRYEPADTRQKTAVKIVLPEAQYDPNNFSKITMGTLIAKGYPISKFMSEGENLNDLSLIEKKTIARNLTAMVKILEIAKIPTFMKGYNTVIIFGVAKICANSHPPVNSFDDFASVGRAIGFQVVNSNTGEVSLDATYDLICYLKDNCEYRKLVLSYDTFKPNPKGGDARLNATIMVSIPPIPEDYRAAFKMMIATSHNYNVQSNNDFIESLEEEKIDLPPSEADQPKITPEGLVEVITKSGYIALVAQPVYNNFQGFINELESTGYTIEDIRGYARSKQSYGYGYKGIDVWSAAASGLGITIDPSKNARGSAVAVRKNNILPNSISSIAKKYGLGWGAGDHVGKYTGYKDSSIFSALSIEGGSIKAPRSDNIYKTDISRNKINDAAAQTEEDLRQDSIPEKVLSNTNGREFVWSEDAIRHYRLTQFYKLPEWPHLEILTAVEGGQFKVGTIFDVYEALGPGEFVKNQYQVWRIAFKTFDNSLDLQTYHLVEISNPEDVKRRNDLTARAGMGMVWLKG